MSTKHSSGEYASDDADVYMPIVRNGSVERQDVIGRFGGLRRFSDNNLRDIVPAVEVLNESDFSDLSEYAITEWPTFVIIPEHLISSVARNKYEEEVEGLLEDTTARDLFETHHDEVDAPVASPPYHDLHDYEEVRARYSALQKSFEIVAARVFLPEEPLDRTQMRSLEQLSREVDEGFVLIDCQAVDNLTVGSTGREILANVREVFEESLVVIVDGFSYFRGQNYNFGPELATGMDGFGYGDYALERRYPQVVPVGETPDTIRQYEYTDRDVAEFEGDSYVGSGSAREDLLDWSEWDPDHCQFCSDIATTDRDDHSFWKAMRMGHYVESAIRH